MNILDRMQVEIQRAPRVFKPTLSLDDGILGWDTNPNSVIDGNTSGESLLYHAASGSFFLESGGNLWCKVIDDSGGLWYLINNEEGE